MDTSVTIPNEIPIIVLAHAVLFPHSLLPLHIFETRYRAMLEASLGGPRIFGVAQPLEWPDPQSPVPDLANVMGIGVIRACVERSVGTSDLILQGLVRVKIIGELESDPFRVVQIETLITEVADHDRADYLTAQLREQSHVLSARGHEMPRKMDQYLESVGDPEVVGDLMAAAFVGDPEIRQQILETAGLETRLEMVLAEMKLLTAS